MKDRSSPVKPPGQPVSTKASFLETGASLLQSTSPMKGFDIYVVGFHCAREKPEQQMEAHHYCRLVNQDFLQCVLFDGNTKDANLVGIEYIVSERLFEDLSEEEKSYWHPHNYEVLSGQLVAPNLPDAAEKEMMKMLVNSYGKTWHTWHSGRHDEGADSGDPLPTGEAKLMWSFNRDGEADEAMKEDRNEAMGIDTDHKRSLRRDLADMAHPQRGVDTLKEAFPDADDTPPPGVRDVESGNKGQH